MKILDSASFFSSELLILVETLQDQQTIIKECVRLAHACFPTVEAHLRACIRSKVIQEDYHNWSDDDKRLFVNISFYLEEVKRLNNGILPRDLIPLLEVMLRLVFDWFNDQLLPSPYFHLQCKESLGYQSLSSTLKEFIEEIISEGIIVNTESFRFFGVSFELGTLEKRGRTSN